MKPKTPQLTSNEPTESDLAMYGKFTGGTIKKRDPEKYASMVRALHQGLSLREVAKVFKVSKNVAGAIACRELGRDWMRNQLEVNLRKLTLRTSEDLLERMDELTPHQKAVILGISADKLERLDSQRLAGPLTQNNIMIAPPIPQAEIEKLLNSLAGKGEKKSVEV